MKLPQDVIIKIHPDGKVEVETEGFTGESCVEIVAMIERILAGENPDDGEIRREFKPEYHLAETEQNQDIREKS